MIRPLVVLIAAGLLAVQIVRNAAVEEFAGSKPAVAAQFWSDHPAVQLSAGMTAIAQAAKDRRAVPASALATISAASVMEPLAPEPYLVRGVQAELDGQDGLAQKSFEAAQWRDPRSLPAAFFLADRYFRTNNVAKGLSEVAAVARLTPNGNQAVAPYLASYARDSANWSSLRAMFRANPELAETALSALASSAETAPAVIALADPRERALDARWIPPLLNTLTASGQYAQARQIWARTSGVQSTELLHDPGFQDKASPPPFNWSLTSSSVGLAERQAGGRLHVLFYGQDSGMLAMQLMLLPPGTYRLSMQLAGSQSRTSALNWSVWCEKADSPVASVTLDAAAAHGWTFTVTANCPAQWLKLSGASTDVPQQVDATVSGLKLERSTSGA